MRGARPGSWRLRANDLPMAEDRIEQGPSGIRALRTRAADGLPVQARVAGDGGPAVLFVHGVGSTAAIWDAQLRAFAGTFRCAAVELRGNGASPDPDPSAVHRDGYAADVLAVADAIDAPRFHLVGCSLGGVVAFELWRRAPERIRSLTLVGSYARYPDGRTYADGIIRAVREAGSMEAFARARAPRLGLPPERLEETIAQMACKSVACYIAATEATWTADHRALLPAITVPVLVIVGEHDTVAPLPLAEEIARAVPGARLEVLPGAGHVANADRPEEFNAMLRAFLTALPE